MTAKPVITVVLRAPAAIPAFIKLGQTVIQSMTNNTWFASPTPTLAVVGASFTALDQAETLAHTRAIGAVEARNAKLVDAQSNLRNVKLYVQGVAEANPENAATIAASAGMSLRLSASRTKAPFTAVHGDVSGAVIVSARAAAQRAAYEWQWSLDQKTWTTMPVTLKATATIPGLPVGASAFFRYRPVTKSGEGDFSQIVALTIK